MTPARRRIPVYCVLPARTLLLDVAGPMEALRAANLHQQDVAFDVRYVGPLPELTSSVGLKLTGIEGLPDRIEPGAMVVLSGHAEQPLDAVQRAAGEGDLRGRHAVGVQPGAGHLGQFGEHPGVGVADRRACLGGERREVRTEGGQQSGVGFASGQVTGTG